jgi:hypothetical protein
MNPWLDGVIALVPAVMVPLWVAARGSTANRVVAVQFATVLTCLSGCSGRGGCKRFVVVGHGLILFWIYSAAMYCGSVPSPAGRRLRCVP